MEKGVKVLLLVVLLVGISIALYWGISLRNVGELVTPTAEGVVFQDGFESGTFLVSNGGAWDFVWGQAKATINSTPAYVHSGANSAQLHYYICGGPIPSPSDWMTPAQVIGGSFGNRKYYTELTYVNALGIESWPNGFAYGKYNVSAGNLSQVNHPSSWPGMVGYNVYVSTSSIYENTPLEPATKQNSVPIPFNTNWVEPASCPAGHTCFAGTAIINDGATPPVPDTACGNCHQDSNIHPAKIISPGLTHFFIRAYIYFKKPELDATPGVAIQRKLMRFSDSPSAGGVNSPGYTYSFLLDSWDLANSGYSPTIHMTVMANGIHRWNIGNITWDAWHSIEFEAQMNTPGSVDGVARVWIDEEKVYEATDMNYRGTYSTPVTYFDIGDQADRGSYIVVNEYRYWDDIVISTNYIGPTTSPSDTTPPTRSNGQPNGMLATVTTQTTLSLQTDEAATCKYSTAAGTAYASMTNTFSTTGGTSHSTAISGLSNSNTYTYYVRCQDASGNANTDDYVITFFVSSAVLFQDGFESGILPGVWGNAGCGTAGYCPAINSTIKYSGNYSLQLHYYICGNPNITSPSDWMTFAQVPGGNFSNTAYYTELTYVSNTSVESWPTGFAYGKYNVSAGNLLQVNPPSSRSGMIGYNVYVGLSTTTATKQNLAPINFSTKWTEPATGLIDGTPPPTSDPACGADHQDSNRWVSKVITANLTDAFIRGYVMFKKPEPGAAQNIQRKTLWVSDCTSVGGCAELADSILTTGDSPNGTITLRWSLNANSKICGTPSISLYPNGSLSYDTWYSIEMETKLNTPGLADGQINVWVDGIQVLHATDVNIRGNCSNTTLHFFKVGNQADRNGYLPVDEYRYWDDIVISDSYIGPGNFTPVNVTPQTCSDGTALSTCSTTKPKYCTSNAQLVDSCSTCGCDSGYSCDPGTQKCVQSTPQPSTLSFPSNLQGKEVAPGKIDLTWIDNSDDENGFIIESTTNTRRTPWTELARVGANVNTYSHIGVTGNSMNYRVKAYNSGGESAYSNQIKVTTHSCKWWKRLFFIC